MIQENVNKVMSSPRATSILTSAVESFNAEAKALSAMANRVDQSFVNAIELILECHGRVIICGMGKSGLVGSKIAATLASTGTPSFFLHPGEALHGDLGMICANDVVIMISNSGETDEVLRLLPALRHFGNPIIGMVGNRSSTLGKAARVLLDVSVEREVCPLNLAPTTSTLVTMAMGDALAVALMRARNFQPQDFARFHPGGSLGRRLLTRVGDVMHRELPIVKPDTVLRETMLVMTAGRLGLAVILEGKSLCGILTDGDLRRAFSERGATLEAPVKQFMTYKPMTIKDDQMLFQAEQRMREGKVKCLVVLDASERVVGVVDIFDG